MKAARSKHQPVVANQKQLADHFDVLLAMAGESTVAEVGDGDPADLDARLASATQYIDDNILRPLSVAEIAGQAATSERTLRRLFRRELGTTVVREVAERRTMAAAAGLIRPDRPTVAEVAAEMHYADAASLTRDFRRYLGCTPSEYKRCRAAPAG